MDTQTQNWQTSLRQAQLISTYMLEQVHALCERHHITYWLDGGTLIGAVRHGGFIPWDDDIDLCMPRPDFERFKELAVEELPEDLYVYDAYTTRGLQKMVYKVRYKHSVLLEDYETKDEGIFLDILPMDYYQNNGAPPPRRVYRWAPRLFAFYLSRNMRMKSWSLPKRALAGVSGFVAKLWPDYYPAIMRRYTRRHAQSISTTQTEYLGYGYEYPWRESYPIKDIFPLQAIPFEHLKGVYAPRNIPAYLAVYYGDDFMTLPSEDKRTWHYVKLFIEKLPPGVEQVSE